MFDVRNDPLIECVLKSTTGDLPLYGYGYSPEDRLIEGRMGTPFSTPSIDRQ